MAALPGPTADGQAGAVPSGQAAPFGRRLAVSRVLDPVTVEKDQQTARLDCRPFLGSPQRRATAAATGPGTDQQDSVVM